MRFARKMLVGVVMALPTGPASSFGPATPATESGSKLYCDERFLGDASSGRAQMCNWASTKAQACSQGMTTSIDNEKFKDPSGAMAGVCPEGSPYENDQVRVYVLK